MTEKLHVVGIGGVGMSAVAQALLDTGAIVSGSDRLLDSGTSTPVLDCLARQGVKLYPQDGSGIDPTINRVIVSTAIENDNLDIIKAHELRILVEHRAVALNRLVAGRELVTITGTCGKSSVTAMLGTILEGCGFDPLVINGAAVVGWDQNGARVGSVRNGAGLAIIEADESDKSLMVFKPDHAVITNAFADHFDLQETLRIFEDFRGRVRGHLIEGNVLELDEIDCSVAGLSGSFVLNGIRHTVPAPGLHNVHNAYHAQRMALALGAEPHQAARALAGYKGVERRLQHVGKCGKAVVFDDYAHNPEKIRAAWSTLARAFDGGVCGVWRPHGYTPLRKMMDDLVRAFVDICRPIDRLLLLPVYDAGGSTQRSVRSEDLALKLHAKGVKVEVIQTLDAAESEMRRGCDDYAVLLCFGARDPGLPELAARLAEKE